MMDIAAAEEEINRWKVAAEQEAAAGTGVEQEFVAQVWNAICWEDFFFGMFAILGGF
jgi:membrane protein required for beta-lactamase induction